MCGIRVESGAAKEMELEELAINFWRALDEGLWTLFVGSRDTIEGLRQSFEESYFDLEISSEVL